jgi:hypothetical protein
MKALILLAASFPAVAQIDRCVPKEFAQYKESAKTAFGVIDVAFDTCRNQKIARAYSLAPTVRTACESEIQKAKDALVAKPEVACVRAQQLRRAYAGLARRPGRCFAPRT